MISLSLTDASRHFLELVRKVCLGREEAVLFEHGEAVARLLPAKSKRMTGAELASSWSSLPKLEIEEADAFVHDLDVARTTLPKVTSSWE